jgi:plastocyanin
MSTQFLSTQNAIAGDTVVFHFYAKNHSVTQSSIDTPCGPKAGGIDSGFMPVAPDATDHPTFSIPVPDTKPIWIFCKQTNPSSHCAAGMVFAVNCGSPGQPNSLDSFISKAKASGNSAATTTYTAPYGGVTVPPPPAASPVTKVVTLDSSTWTTAYTSYAGSPEPTPAALNGQTHKVTVGESGLVFNPSTLSVAPRDTVVFEFHAKNHTVTQSSFDDPCRRLTANGQVTGFDSGFMPVDPAATTFPTWTLTVNDTAPIWVYCRQKNPSSHCGSGMVMAINSVDSSPRNFNAFQGLAKQLNGTSAPATAPSATPTGGAAPLRVGGMLTVVLAAVLAALL